MRGGMRDCVVDCPAKLWCLVSGGKDSITTAHALAARDKLAGCVFIDTGIAIPEVKPFVQDLCQDQGWDLEIYRTNVDYGMLVRKIGFPGPAMHSMFMHRLKMRGVRQWKKAHKGEMLASGVRMAESKRRLASVKPESKLEGVRTLAPIYDWSTPDVWDYVRTNELPLSPGYKTLHLSGDCLCGAFSRPEERMLIQTFHPEVWGGIATLEQQVEQEATVKNRWSWTWGNHGGSARHRRSAAEKLACETCVQDRRLSDEP